MDTFRKEVYSYLGIDTLMQRTYAKSISEFWWTLIMKDVYIAFILIILMALESIHLCDTDF